MFLCKAVLTLTLLLTITGCGGPADGKTHLTFQIVIIKVCHVGQHAEVGVVQQLVGMHPEDVRHGVAFGGSFQLCPVFAPAGGLHLDHHIV